MIRRRLEINISTVIIILPTSKYSASSDYSALVNFKIASTFAEKRFTIIEEATALIIAILLHYFIFDAPRHHFY